MLILIYSDVRINEDASTRSSTRDRRSARGPREASELMVYVQLLSRTVTQ